VQVRSQKGKAVLDVKDIPVEQARHLFAALTGEQPPAEPVEPETVG
jgi:hypothetical protein